VTPRDRVRNLVESEAFQRSIIAVILLNAVTLGLETSHAVMEHFGTVLHVLDRIMLGIFVVELSLRLYAHGLRFFRDPWGVFDFLVVSISLVPASSGLSVLRALRVLRTLRLISAVPGMRMVVSGLLNAIPAMTSIIALLLLVIYVGAVLGTELYGATAPQHFGDLGSSLFTLFQVMTGEAWPDIAADVLPSHPTAWIFFVIFILISTFVVLNLFTAVVVSAMEPERRQEMVVDATLLAEIRALRGEIENLRAERDPAPQQRAGGG
jgi:voltage-gated sodium channel